jgi:hypothetical protein
LREFYGGNPLYINDGAICDDIRQVGKSSGNLFAGFSFDVDDEPDDPDDPDDPDNFEEVKLSRPETRKYARKRRAARTSTSGTSISSMCSPRFLLVSLD